MKIRRIDIENFRGVRRLSWRLPADQTFYVLVGPGDATKSTILTALERGLSDRWNVSFTDSDFYDGDVDQPIRIRIAVSELPESLLALDAFGQVLCGIDAAGEWTHDATDENEECVIVELRVDADLESHWGAFRPGEDNEGVEPPALKTKHRARFGAYRIDERIDAHLRWSRMSALGKLTEKEHGARDTLTKANRAAREAAAAAVSPALKGLAGEIGRKVADIGSADFKDLKPGLDTSLSNSQGILALFDGPIPLTNYGLGTRRLAGVAAQQLAHDGAAILLVDEVEHGLEPHRLVHLLNHLRVKDAFAQVFVTTHSPTALQHLDASDLVMVRSTGGITTVRTLGDPSSLQSVIRAEPEAFLSRRVLVCEGKTEYGLALALLEEWNVPQETGLVPSAALGVVPFEGGGGTKAIGKAHELIKVGYEVTLFMDSDDAVANEKAAEVAAQGVVVIQWDGAYCTEEAVAAELDVAGLTMFIGKAIAAADDPGDAAKNYIQHLREVGAPANATGDVSAWISEEFTLAQARALIGKTANLRKWFKNVNRGKPFAEIIQTNLSLEGGPVWTKIEDLRKAIYEPRPKAEQPETTEFVEQTFDEEAGT